MDQPAALVKHKLVESLWLCVDIIDRDKYLNAKISLDIGSEVLPFVGHGHHNLTWLIYDLLEENKRLKGLIDKNGIK